MARVLVTGAAGFIGANLVRALLERGDDVHVCVRPGSTAWRLRDIAKKLHIHEIDMKSAVGVARLVSEVEPEHVYHLAHYGGNKNETDPALVRKTVIEGTAALYDACRDVGGVQAIVHAGSSSEYGAKDEPMREDMVPDPTTEYGVAKVQATGYGRQMAQKFKLPVVTLRLFAVYGPYEAPDRLIPAVILKCLGKRELLELSNPATVRDFVYVDDVVAAFIRAAANPVAGEVFNVGTGVESSIEAIVSTVIQLTGASLDPAWGTFPERSFDRSKWKADTSHSARVLGWKSTTNLHAGLTKTISWFREHDDLYE